MSAKNGELKDLQEIVRRWLMEQRDARQLSAIAEASGIKGTRLTEMIRPNKYGKLRKVTRKYVHRLVRGGKLDLIAKLKRQGKDLADLSENDQDFMVRNVLIADDEAKMIAEIKEKGFNLRNILKAVLKK